MILVVKRLDLLSPRDLSQLADAAMYKSAADAYRCLHSDRPGVFAVYKIDGKQQVVVTEAATGTVVAHLVRPRRSWSVLRVPLSNSRIVEGEARRVTELNLLSEIEQAEEQ